jgi:beta-alanine degradation protein BauB
MSEISEDVGSKLLFENDRVRVWDLRLTPGESTGKHRHENDYLYVVIGDGELQDRKMEDGEVRWRDVDGEDVHEATNTGSTDWRNIIVELK